MSVKHDDFVEVKVEITRKQRDWLTTLGEDLRYDISYAFRLLVDREIEAHEKDPFNPLRYSVRNRFENCVKNQCKDELDEAKKLLNELNIMLDIAYKEEEARSLRVKLMDAQKDRP